MFTGLIEATGVIAAITPMGGDVRLTIRSQTLDFTDVRLGDSIAANGICLTVVALQECGYVVDVSRETMQKSTLMGWQVGDVVNLEKALLPTTRLGGHLVAGHVDGVGSVVAIQKSARAVDVQLQLPRELMKYTADKGSITVDGISLTTNAVLVEQDVVCLTIIPHTAQHTNIDRHWRIGAKVNIEVDLVARYLERLLLGNPSTPNNHTSTIDEAFLAKAGFIR